MNSTFGRPIGRLVCSSICKGALHLAVTLGDPITSDVEAMARRFKRSTGPLRYKNVGRQFCPAIVSHRRFNCARSFDQVLFKPDLLLLSKLLTRSATRV